MGSGTTENRSGGQSGGFGIGAARNAPPPQVQPRAQLPAGPAYRSPGAGLGAATLQGMPSPQNLPISPRAQLTPDMLAPKVTPVDKPDPIFDPAWSQLEAQKDNPVGNYDFSSLYYARGGHVREPSEAQKSAGNYKKGHIRFQGLDISIENPKGSVRRGKDPDGKPWRCVMPADYGYVRRTEGADGDHVDVFVGPHHDSHTVFIINQQHHATGKFDEHKAMLGYRSEKEACDAYCRAFSDGKGPHRIQSIETVSVDAFKSWLKSGKTLKAAKGSRIVDHAISNVIRRHERG